MTTTLLPVRTIPAYAVIIRAIWEGGPVKREARRELKRRGLWLSEDQKRESRTLARRRRQAK
jgi:hypothetical protein